MVPLPFANDMASSQPDTANDPLRIGEAIHALLARLFPLHRSQTGAGNRQTFEILSELVPWKIHETPSGTPAFSWTIPREWEITDAHISWSGRRLVDYRESNLHVFNGSRPVRARMTFAELEPHLVVHESFPDAIPYRTAFFRDHWGFCLTRQQWEQLKLLDGPFEVVIDSREFDGSLTHAEFETQTDAEKSFLIWAHCCHPSLANDNLSGVAIAAWLARELAQRPTRHNYRFVLAPATIGAINWIHQNDLGPFVGGIVLTLLGDNQPFHYKMTPSGRTEIDRAFEYLALTENANIRRLEFDPLGYDERQFGAPDCRLKTGRLTRALPGEFPEYHSSRDNLEFVRPEYLGESFELLRRAIDIVDANRVYKNLHGQCEPFLQPYDLYRGFGDDRPASFSPTAVMWVLHLADGRRDLIDMAIRSQRNWNEIRAAADALHRAGLLEPRDIQRDPPG